MTAKKQQPKLSPTSKKLVDIFDEAAQLHGWEADQGSPNSAYEARARWAEAKTALTKRILKLEVELKRYRDQEAADHAANTTADTF